MYKVIIKEKFRFRIDNVPYKAPGTFIFTNERQLKDLEMLLRVKNIKDYSVENQNVFIDVPKKEVVAPQNKNKQKPAVPPRPSIK